MAKKILILSEPFAPPSCLPRITNLCKNLDRNKWTPEIFTEKIKDVNYSTDLCPVFQMPYYNSNNKIYWTIKWVLHFLFQYKDFKLQKFIENTTNVNDYDLIFCSISNLFPITTAARLSKKYNKPPIDIKNDSKFKPEPSEDQNSSSNNETDNQNANQTSTEKSNSIKQKIIENYVS